MNKSILIIGLTAMLFFAPACLEDLFSTEEEEELNQDLIGVWYRFTMVEDGVSYGLPALVKLLDNGNGTVESIDSTDQEEPNFDSFVWTTDGAAITITDENDSTVWSGSFTLSDNNNVVRFTYSSDGHSYDEIYVKYSGEKDPDLVGTWIMVDSQIGLEKPLTIQRIVFNQDGSATDYRIDDLEESTDIEVDLLTWNSNSHYLAVFDEGDHMPLVIQYTITNGVFAGMYYDEDGEFEEFTFVLDAGDMDPDGMGSWTLSSVTVDGFLNPIIGLQINLDLNDDGSGLWTMITLAGTESFSFNWKTNGGYVFIYRDDMPLIAWVQEYTISGNTMMLKTDTEYFEGYGWVTVEYAFTRSS